MSNEEVEQLLLDYRTHLLTILPTAVGREVSVAMYTREYVRMVFAAEEIGTGTVPHPRLLIDGRLLLRLGDGWSEAIGDPRILSVYPGTILSRSLLFEAPTLDGLTTTLLALIVAGASGLPADSKDQTSPAKGRRRARKA